MNDHLTALALSPLPKKMITCDLPNKLTPGRQIQEVLMNY